MTETGSEKMSCGETFQPVCGFAHFAAADLTHFITSSSEWLAKLFTVFTTRKTESPFLECGGGVVMTKKVGHNCEVKENYS